MELLEQAQDNLERAAAVFLEYPKTAIVAQGHTDSLDDQAVGGPRAHAGHAGTGE